MTIYVVWMNLCSSPTQLDLPTSVWSTREEADAALVATERVAWIVEQEFGPLLAILERVE